MTQLLQTWRDSLVLFIPKNFKLFVLVTLNNAMRTYKYLFTYFWWVFIVTIIAQPALLQIIKRFIGISCGLHMFVTHVLVMGFVLLWLFAIYLCARPSVLPKNWTYFKQYLFHLFYFIVVMVVATAGFQFVLFPLMQLNIIFVTIPTWLFIIYYTISMCNLFPLFLLNANADIREVILSIQRSFVMALYNLPAVFILFVIISVVYGLPFYITKLLINIPLAFFICYTGAMLLLPLVICVWVTLYTKKLHDQFNFYFKTNTS